MSCVPVQVIRHQVLAVSMGAFCPFHDAILDLDQQDVDELMSDPLFLDPEFSLNLEESMEAMAVDIAKDPLLAVSLGCLSPDCSSNYSNQSPAILQQMSVGAWSPSPSPVLLGKEMDAAAMSMPMNTPETYQQHWQHDQQQRWPQQAANFPIVHFDDSVGPSFSIPAAAAGLHAAGSLSGSCSPIPQAAAPQSVGIGAVITQQGPAAADVKPSTLLQQMFEQDQRHKQQLTQQLPQVLQMPQQQQCSPSVSAQQLAPLALPLLQPVQPHQLPVSSTGGWPATLPEAQLLQGGFLQLMHSAQPMAPQHSTAGGPASRIVTSGQAIAAVPSVTMVASLGQQRSSSSSSTQDRSRPR